MKDVTGIRKVQCCQGAAELLLRKSRNGHTDRAADSKWSTFQANASSARMQARYAERRTRWTTIWPDLAATIPTGRPWGDKGLPAYASR